MWEAGTELRGDAHWLPCAGFKDVGGGARGAESWPESQFWETGLAAPGWTWPLPAPAARGTQAPELPGMPSAVLKGRKDRLSTQGTRSSSVLPLGMYEMQGDRTGD